MRAAVQRVSHASVSVDGAVVGAIGRGFVVLVCAMAGDTEADAERLARKIALLRVFRDGAGKMNLPLSSVDGAVLAVSQFTLAADGMEGGNRPGFSKAAVPADGRHLYSHFCNHVASHGVCVQRGIFGADMQVALVNDGPVTIWFDTAC